MFLLKDAISMTKDIDKSSRLFGLWGKVLNLPHVIGGIIYINRPEGLFILLTAIFSVLVAAQIHKRQPFSRLTSLVHLVWIPLFPYLVQRVTEIGLSTAFGMWLAFSTLMMGISLILDVRNLILYRNNKKFESAF